MIPSLNGLRAISIVLVLFGHLNGTRFGPNWDLERFVGDYAALGVRVFFVISGYLITSLLLKEQAETGDISLRKFYIRRSLRIFPAFLAFFGVIAALNWTGHIQLHAYDLLAAFTYTANFHEGRSWYVGHLWSLSVEEQFYLLWPWTVRALGPRASMWAAGAMFVIAPVTRGAMRIMFRNDPIRDLPIFPAIADGLAAGCLLAGLQPWLSGQKWYRKITGSWLVVLLLPVIVICNLALGFTVGTVFAMPVMLVALAMLIDAAIRHHKSWAGRLLNSGPLVTIGLLSYSLYLWQQPFLNRASEAPLTAFPVNLLAASGVAVASYYLLEQPLLAMRKRFR